jgi:hypothetical protein
MGNIPVDMALLLLIEKSAANDDELSSHFDIYDICSKKTGEDNLNKWAEYSPVAPLALDPCESAAQVFKCGVENSVSGMTNLIAAGAAAGEMDAQVEFKSFTLMSMFLKNELDRRIAS